LPSDSDIPPAKALRRKGFNKKIFSELSAFAPSREIFRHLLAALLRRVLCGANSCSSLLAQIHDHSTADAAFENLIDFRVQLFK
jgi:hypothetical protein